MKTRQQTRKTTHTPKLMTVKVHMNVVPRSTINTNGETVDS